MGALDGKVAIVTGGASGMGKVMARAMLDAGARVAAVDRNEDGLAAFAAEAGAAGAADRFRTFACDVRDRAAIAAMVEGTIERFGGLHALVNNAGLGPHHVVAAFAERKVKFWEAKPEDWQRLFDVNVKGPFLTACAVVPHLMRQGWGRIVNVTTSFDTMLEEGFSPYGPAKAALEAQSAIWAKDLRGTGVTVNILVPGGAADTPFVPVRAGQDRAKLVRPEVMAAPIVWLVSDASDGVTGARFVGRLWDNSLPPGEAAAKVRAPIGWEGFGVQSASRSA
jgi:NAD(P)-dependent dehydrogenase (short-subunit alcohol dehydrogenase family)